MKRNSRLREVMLAYEIIEELHVWHNWNTFPQAAQKVRPTRPQPMKAPEA
jgi:glutaredoxin-related protein